jgi:polyhydroxyalkanoate synthesis regulator phasin
MKHNPNITKLSVLVIFQQLLSDIPNLTAHKIKSETDRIKTASRSADIFGDLVKAVIKSNIVLMTYNSDSKKKDLMQTRYHESIIVHDFVHSCYIAAARSYHSRPEIFWTGYDSIVLNQNKRLCFDIIKDAIRESINLALPMNEILSEYNNNPYEQKDDIRIYILGAKPQSIDLDNHNLLNYPAKFDRDELLKRGITLRSGDEEYMNAADLIKRDIGIYEGGASLLESDQEDGDHFAPGINENDHNENYHNENYHNENDLDRDMSRLIGSKSDTDIAKSGTSLLESGSSEQDGNHDDHGHNNYDTGSDDENMEGGSDKSNATQSQQSVVDGIKMVNLKASISGRGAAKSFFEDVLPDANKKAEEYRKKMQRKPKDMSSDSDSKTGSGGSASAGSVSAGSVSAGSIESIDSKTGVKDTNTSASDKSGIKIVRKDARLNSRVQKEKAVDTDPTDTISSNVEDLLLNSVLKNKK